MIDSFEYLEKEPALWEEANDKLAEVCARMTKWEEEAKARGEYLRVQRPNPMTFIEDYIADVLRQKAASQ
jgi:hypothetical protein